MEGQGGGAVVIGQGGVGGLRLRDDAGGVLGGRFLGGPLLIGAPDGGDRRQDDSQHHDDPQQEEQRLFLRMIHALRSFLQFPAVEPADEAVD